MKKEKCGEDYNYISSKVGTKLFVIQGTEYELMRKFEGFLTIRDFTLMGKLEIGRVFVDPLGDVICIYYGQKLDNCILDRKVLASWAAEIGPTDSNWWIDLVK